MKQGETSMRTAIVTGGAGGLGSVISRRLAGEGYTVIVADLDQARVDAVVEELPAVAGPAHQGFAGDLTSSAVNRELAELAASVAPIGLIVNAVGISPKKDGQKIPFTELNDELWNSILAVNLSAPFYLLREAAPYLAEDGTASIINLLSITARVGTGAPSGAEFGPFIPSSIAYGATKAALHNMTKSLAHELAERRVRVNGVAPGYVRTAMMDSVPQDKRLLSSVPMGRLAEPEEVADAIVFLASERASYITGACLDLNGGWSVG